MKNALLQSALCKVRPYLQARFVVPALGLCLFAVLVASGYCQNENGFTIPDSGIVYDDVTNSVMDKIKAPLKAGIGIAAAIAIAVFGWRLIRRFMH